MPELTGVSELSLPFQKREWLPFEKFSWAKVLIICPLRLKMVISILASFCSEKDIVVEGLKGLGKLLIILQIGSVIDSGFDEVAL